METTDPVGLTEDQAFDALDETPVEETPTEEAEAPVEEQTEADEEAVEESDDVDESDEEDDSEVEEDDDAEDEPVKESDTFTVKVDGKDVSVTLDDLKRSYSGQKFIQKGMEENAQARKALQEEFHTLQTQREQFSQFVQSMQRTGVTPQPTPPDPKLAQTDPIGYMQERAEYEQNLAAYQQQQYQFQQVEQQKAEQAERQKQALFAEQKAKLVEAIPDFGDPQKAARARDAIVGIGQKFGFSAEELAGVTDHRAIVVLHELLKLEAVTASKRKVEEKVAKARPAAKPGNANKTSGKAAKRRETLQKLRDTGSDEYALSLLDE